MPSKGPCPKCGARLGDVCWPGINNDLHELNRLRKGIQDYLDGNFGPDFPTKYDTCPHKKFGWEDCGQCIDEHFTTLLNPKGEANGL